MTTTGETRQQYTTNSGDPCPSRFNNPEAYQAWCDQPTPPTERNRHMHDCTQLGHPDPHSGFKATLLGLLVSLAVIGVVLAFLLVLIYDAVVGYLGG